MKKLMLCIGSGAVFAVAGCKRSVPKVEGQDLKSATSKLEQSGFKLGPVNQIFTGTSESAIVVSQNPTAATKMPGASPRDWKTLNPLPRHLPDHPVVPPTWGQVKLWAQEKFCRIERFVFPKRIASDCHGCSTHGTPR